MPNLRAKKRFPYGRKVLQVGEAFEASEKEAKLLKAIGKAEDDTGGGPKKIVDLPAKAKEVKEEPAPLSEPNEYLTRDMKAGPTGHAKPSRSSPRGRASKAKTSPAFDEDDE